MSDTKPTQKFTSIGGQAILEGVMMRSPGYVAFAVRRPDGLIQVRSRPHAGFALKFPALKLPVLRGVSTLVESMAVGMEALSYSAEIADPSGAEAQKPTGQKNSKLAIAASIATAILMGFGLFVVLPHVLANFLLPKNSGAFFHLVDGLIKIAVLLTYVYAISLLPEIRRVFQYHGAEHKSIYAFEAGLPLDVASAARQSTLHPRCGTSFLLFLVLVSVAVFSIFFPLVGLSQIVGQSMLGHAVTILLKFVLMLPIAGIAYEVIKASACRMDRWWLRALVWPGLKLQLLTTREPDPQQLEVALVSLREVLLLEKELLDPAEERIYGKLEDLNEPTAQVAEFLEA
jgi:uncharacterized protein YqhQ